MARKRIFKKFVHNRREIFGWKRGAQSKLSRYFRSLSLVIGDTHLESYHNIPCRIPSEEIPSARNSYVFHMSTIHLLWKLFSSSAMKIVKRFQIWTFGKTGSSLMSPCNLMLAWVGRSAIHHPYSRKNISVATKLILHFLRVTAHINFHLLITTSP